MQDTIRKISSPTQLAQEHNSIQPFSTKYFDDPIHFKQVEENYIVYRKKYWQQNTSFKTIIMIPGSAYLHFNSHHADGLSIGLLHQLTTDYQVIFLPFPHAPEHKFPTPVLHLQKTISFLLKYHQRYCIDPTNMILGGYSCGGTMTIPLGIHFADHPFSFRSLMCLSPIFDYTGQLDNNKVLSNKWGRFQSQDHRMFRKQFTNFLNWNYSTCKKDLFHPWYSPYFTPTQDLSKLHNICFIYGEFDYMRRTIEAFKEKLNQAQIDSQSIVLNGEGHGAFLLAKIKGQMLEPYPQRQVLKRKLEMFQKVTKVIKKIMK